MNKISNFGNKKAFSLYVWLILFTLIISTASIVIFNYVAADIKTATKFSRNINNAIKLDSYAIAAVELYKSNNLRSSDILDTGYRYTIQPIDSSTLLVSILKGNDLYAKYVMQYSIDLGGINKIVGSNTTFKADNQYNNTLIASDTSSIQDNAYKIFNNLIILPNASITKASGGLINYSEFSRYTNNLITDIDIPNLNQTLNEYISDYYKNYYQSLYNKYYEGVNLKSGVALYEDNNIVFTNEGDLIIKKQAKLIIYEYSTTRDRTRDGTRAKLDTYIDLTINDTNERYYLAISKNLAIQGNNPYVFDYLTEKAMQTNDQTLANNYQNRIESEFSYDNDVAKIINLPDKYISIKTPNKQFIIVALDNLELESTNTINNNFVIVTALNKGVTIRLPFKYFDYDEVNHAIYNSSNSLVKVISNNISIDANNSNNIDITGSFISFYNPDSFINIINATNDVKINVFGSFQTYRGVKVNGFDIFNTSAKEFYYSDPRVDELNDIANLKLYRTQILAKEILKIPKK